LIISVLLCSGEYGLVSCIPRHSDRACFPTMTRIYISNAKYDRRGQRHEQSQLFRLRCFAKCMLHDLVKLQLTVSADRQAAGVS
jgi:hypothetical protein